MYTGLETVTLEASEALGLISDADWLGLYDNELLEMTRHAAAPESIAQFMWAIEHTLLTGAYPRSLALLSTPDIYMRFMHENAAGVGMDQWLADVVWHCLNGSPIWDEERDPGRARSAAEVVETIWHEHRTSGRNMLDYLQRVWGPHGNPPINGDYFDRPHLNLRVYHCLLYTVRIPVRIQSEFSLNSVRIQSEFIPNSVRV